MLFNSLIFLLFITIFFIIYYQTSGQLRIFICLLGSYLFYAWWDWRFLLLIILLTYINYRAGYCIAKSSDTIHRKTYLVVSLIGSLGVLCYFKYFNFFIENLLFTLNELFGISNHYHLNIILPVGISFYTFQCLSYTIDIYRGDILKPEKSFLHFATFVAFFPQLVAGPIVRAKDFLPQLHSDHILTYENFSSGLLMIVWGYFLKCVLADSLSLIVDPIFASPHLQSSLQLLIGVFFYSFQIYGDFGGYSMIAIGIAKILGINFALNFNRPYFSANFREFWKRWHISLSSWFRDYLYIPLGGNKRGVLRSDLNMMLTMALCGLWHGASWSFVLWGCMHGLYILINRVIYRLKFVFALPTESISILRYPLTILKISICFYIVTITWVFFRAESLSDAIYIFIEIFNFNNMHLFSVTGKFHIIKGIFIIGIVVILEGISFFIPLRSLLKNYCVFIITTVLGLIGISMFGTFGNNSFIYFQF